MKFAEKINGYKTLLYGFITIVSGVALQMGIEIPPEVLQTLQDNIIDTVSGILVTLGTISTVLRFFTNGPVAKGKLNAKG